MTRYVQTNVSSVSGVNAELVKIDTAIDSMLDRNGVAPNSMEADIDLNSNKLLNVAAGTSGADGVNYSQLVAIGSLNVGNTSSIETQVTATAGQTVFTTPTYVQGLNNLHVYINGQKQYITASYTETSTTSVTFSTGLSLDDVVEFIVNQIGTTLSTVLSGNVQYSASGSGAVASNVRDKLHETVSVKDFGAVGNGIADDTAAIVNAVATSAKTLFYPDGTYLITNFFKDVNTLHVGDNAFWKVGATIIPIPNIANETTGSSTIYVDAATGSDTANNGLSSGYAYKTIQFAYDSLPTSILHQQTIQLADGTYNTNYLSDATSVAMPRPAILFARGKFVANRTQKTSGVLSGGIIIKGNSTTPANVVLEPNDTYNYGIYCSQSQLGLQDFHIVVAAASTNIVNLLTVHRTDAYVHAVAVTLDGLGTGNIGTDTYITDNAILAESGGIIEFTTGDNGATVKNCVTLANSISAGGTIGIGGNLDLLNCNYGLNADSGAYIKWSSAGATGKSISNCSDAALRTRNGSTIMFRGTSLSSRMIIESPCFVEGSSSLDLVWVDLDSTLSVTNGSSAKFDGSGFQDQITVSSSDLWIRSSASYILGGPTANTNATPIIFRDGSRLYQEGTNDIVGSSGGLLKARDVVEQTVGADGATIFVPAEFNAVTRINTSANRVNCVLPAGTYQYQTLEIFGYAGFSVQIIESTTASISNNSVKIAGLSTTDAYMGIKFIWKDTVWYEMSRSRAGA